MQRPAAAAATAPHLYSMMPTGALAVAIGIACLVLIAFVSMRGARRRRRARDGGPIIPLGDPYDDDGGDGDGS